MLDVICGFARLEETSDTLKWNDNLPLFSGTKLKLSIKRTNCGQDIITSKFMADWQLKLPSVNRWKSKKKYMEESKKSALKSCEKEI